MASRSNAGSPPERTVTIGGATLVINPTPQTALHRTTALVTKAQRIALRDGSDPSRLIKVQQDVTSIIPGCTLKISQASVDDPISLQETFQLDAHLKLLKERLGNFDLLQLFKIIFPQPTAA